MDNHLKAVFNRLLPVTPAIFAVVVAGILLVYEQSKGDNKDYWAPYVLIALGLVFAFNLQSNVSRILSAGKLRDAVTAGRVNDTRLDGLWDAIAAELLALEPAKRVQARLVLDQGIRSLYRLDRTTAALVTRGNLNLSFGIMLGVSGLLIIGSLSFLDPIDVGDWNGLLRMVPRTGLALLVEALAFFFLKLYKNSLDDARYIQNEITTLEAKLLATFLSVFSSSETLTDVVARGLLATERNIVLNKDQSQAWLERTRIETDATQKASAQIAELLTKIWGDKSKLRAT